MKVPHFSSNSKTIFVHPGSRNQPGSLFHTSTIQKLSWRIITIFFRSCRKFLYALILRCFFIAFHDVNKYFFEFCLMYSLQNQKSLSLNVRCCRKRIQKIIYSLVVAQLNSIAVAFRCCCPMKIYKFQNSMNCHHFASNSKTIFAHHGSRNQPSPLFHTFNYSNTQLQDHTIFFLVSVKGCQNISSLVVQQLYLWLWDDGNL